MWWKVRGRGGRRSCSRNRAARDSIAEEDIVGILNASFDIGRMVIT